MIRNILMAAGSGAVWTPEVLFASGEQGVWYDPSDFSTMFQDSAGTTPVTAVDQYVGKILDKSGRGNHAMQSTSKNRPQLKADGDLYYLLFNGTAYWMVTANIDFTASNKMLLCAGITKERTSGYEVIAELSTNVGSGAGMFLFQGTNTLYAPLSNYAYVHKGTGAYIVSDTNLSTYDAPVTNIITGLSDLSTNTCTLRVDSIEIEKNTTGVNGGNFSNRPLYIANRNSGVSVFSGRLYSFIIRSATTDVSLIETVENYVAAQTGITL